MANIFGSNYTKEFINDPSEPANIGEYNGKVRAMIDSFSGAVAADDVYFGKIPAGAIILSLSAIGGGASPTFNVAVGDKITAEQDLICTLDAGALASGKCICQYVLE
jgi:hypothetical protein